MLHRAYPFLPYIPYIPNMSLSPSFLARLLLKVSKVAAFTDEEIAILESAAADVAAEQPTSEPEAEPQETHSQVPKEPENTPVLAPTQAPPAPAAQPKTIKKVKCVEDSAAPTAAVYVPPEISTRHCLARMVQKKQVLPGTDANKVYEAKQCIRLRAKGELLCPKCEEYYTAFKEKSKGKANWEGFINETPLDHLHIVGSKWFREQYPAGLPAGDVPSTPAAPVETPAPSNPANETVLAENAPVQEVQWTRVKIGGVHYIYNMRDRRIYRADISKEGEEQILWDTYAGKYVNGTIDAYAPETEDDE